MIDKHQAPLKPGNVIRILTGIFENYEGTIESIDGEEIVVHPRIFIGHGYRPLKLRKADVEPISDDGAT